MIDTTEMALCPKCGGYPLASMPNCVIAASCAGCSSYGWTQPVHVQKPIGIATPPPLKAIVAQERSGLWVVTIPPWPERFCGLTRKAATEQARRTIRERIAGFAHFEEIVLP